MVFSGGEFAQLCFERKREIGLHRRVGFTGKRFWDIVPDDHREASRLERIAEAFGDAEAFGRRSIEKRFEVDDRNSHDLPALRILEITSGEAYSIAGGRPISSAGVAAMAAVKP